MILLSFIAGGVLGAVTIGLFAGQKIGELQYRNDRLVQSIKEMRLAKNMEVGE